MMKKTEKMKAAQAEAAKKAEVAAEERKLAAEVQEAMEAEAETEAETEAEVEAEVKPKAEPKKPEPKAEPKKAEPKKPEPKPEPKPVAPADEWKETSAITADLLQGAKKVAEGYIIPAYEYTGKVFLDILVAKQLGGVDWRQKVKEIKILVDDKSTKWRYLRPEELVAYFAI